MSRTADADFEVREAIEKIRQLQAAEENWCEENEDLCGDDDATWFDTISEFNSQLADAGIELANLLERLMGAGSDLDPS